MQPTIWITISVAVAALFLFSIVVLASRRYKRCPSNRILVIYGKVGSGSTAKCIHGGAAFVIPLIQDYDYLSLEPMQIEVPLKDALSMENIRVSVPSVFTIAIGTEPDMMTNAAIRLLGLEAPSIRKQAEDIIFGQLRQVIASMKIEDINRDRDAFLHNIQANLEPELRKIGMVLINVNITDITDESGYIEAIGKKAASEAIQRARGDVADELRKGEIRVAEAEREKHVQVASNVKDQEIGIRAAKQQQAVRVAELEKEQVVGEQVAAFQRQSQVTDAERDMRVSVAAAHSAAQVGEAAATFDQQMRVKDSEKAMRIRVAEADARAIEGENESKAAVAASNATLRVKEADSYQLGATREEVARAGVLEAKNRALAKAAQADGERVEAEQRAELEAKAKAEKARTIVEAEAKAEQTRLEALGDASAIFARLEAEAKGQFEILSKKAEGFRAIVQACGSADAAFRLLMLEHLDTLAHTSAEAISKIKFDKVIVWENAGENGKGSTANFLNSLAKSLPPMMQVMKDIGGIEFPETLIKMVDDKKPAGDGATAVIESGNGGH